MSDATVWLKMRFHKATDAYLKMPDEVRAKLPALAHYDNDVGADGYAELISASHAFNDLTGLTEPLIQAVLIKVIEYAAKVVARGHQLHVGDLVVTRQSMTLEGVQLIKENAFVPVKMV
jgi:hypothetical protein